MTVLVAMPYWRTPDEVQRAVDSVLCQTYRDLRLVVIGDGEEPPVRSTDSRLDVFTLPENRGPYFALEVALRASGEQWFAPMGSDDWVEPDHIESLLAVGAQANFPSAVYVDEVAQAGSWWYVGVFATEALARIGGHDPSQYIEQDTLMANLLRLTSHWGISNKATYHQVTRPRSLTRESETGFGSPYRQRAITKRRAILQQARRLRSPERIWHYRRGLIPGGLSWEVDLEAHRLRAGDQAVA